RWQSFPLSDRSTRLPPGRRPATGAGAGRLAGAAAPARARRAARGGGFPPLQLPVRFGRRTATLGCSRGRIRRGQGDRNGDRKQDCIENQGKRGIQNRNNTHHLRYPFVLVPAKPEADFADVLAESSVDARSSLEIVN